jgi:hypothetical protein
VERLPRSAKDMASKLVAALARPSPKSGNQTENSDSAGDDAVVAEFRAENPSGARTTAED